MAAHNDAALHSRRPPLAGVGSRPLLITAASLAGALLALAGLRAGWPVAIAGTAVVVHLGLAFAALWHLVAARASRRGLAARFTALEAEHFALRAHAASVAHDMRAPIVTVCSYLELLVEDAFGPLPAAARHAAKQAVRASTRAHSLVESTLAGHPATPTSTAPGTPAVDLEAVLRDVVAALATEFTRTGAKLDIGPLPRLAGAESAYYRIFANLIENAIRYSKPGTPPHIEVSGVETATGCEIAVHDDGIGIAASDRERVFIRRVRLASGPATSGHGIGLATVRELITGLGGSVWVDPATTDGVCIRFTLPLSSVI